MEWPSGGEVRVKQGMGTGDDEEAGVRGDGDGWVIDPDGTRYWGVHGAAGLLLRTRLADGATGILLQHRAIWSHQGGTWGLPGGARDSHENAVDTAIREADEEAGIGGEELRVIAAIVTHTAPSGWTYTTVIADVDEPIRTVANGESAELRWVDERDVDELPLHPAFRRSWFELRERMATLDLPGGTAENVPLPGHESRPSH